MYAAVIHRAYVLSCATRLEIWEHVDKLPAHPGDVARSLGLAPSTISHHLRILEQAGLVRHVKLGRYRQYSATGTRWGVLSEDEVEAMLSDGACDARGLQ